MKRTLIVLGVLVGATLCTAGIVNAVGLEVESLRVGTQGAGGVTWFNGTIINETTGTGGADNPVAFGDNVRIDGRVWRGATAGTGDTQPFIVNDNMEVAGSLTVGSFAGTGIITSAHIADGVVSSTDIADATIATADIADDAVTPAKINGTGGANLPIAYGYCDSDGSTRGGTSNVTCSWDGGNSRYSIAIDGVNYYFNQYVTLITATGDNFIAETSSVGGNLLVDFITHAGTTGQQTDFVFVVYDI